MVSVSVFFSNISPTCECSLRFPLKSHKKRSEFDNLVIKTGSKAEQARNAEILAEKDEVGGGKREKGRERERERKR
jgi:hypothetical protein